MLTGRFVNKLVNDRLMFYQTDGDNGPEKLLNPRNLAEVWNLGKEKPEGEYFKRFPDDMAFTYTVISYSYDSSGRPCADNDTVIVKFNGGDSDKILGLLETKYEYARRMKQATQTHEVLTNPLREVIL